MSGKKWDPNTWGVVLIAAVLAVIAVIVINLIILQRNYIEVDSATNCPKNEITTYPSTVLLIDQSDPITPSQKRYLIGYIEDLKRSFSLFEKVAIYPIDSISGGSPTPLFERCNPGSPEEANVWFENPEQIREKFEADFSRPFSEAFDRSIADAAAETSPIIETIQSVMSNHSLDDRITRQRLILISDMLHNVPEYSHYRDGHSYNDFVSSSYSLRTDSNLVGVGVTVVYLWRSGVSPKDVDAHLLFWEEFIRQNGGVLEQVFKVR